MACHHCGRMPCLGGEACELAAQLAETDGTIGELRQRVAELESLFRARANLHRGSESGPSTKLGLCPEARLALEALAVDLGCSMTAAAERLLALPHSDLVTAARHGTTKPALLQRAQKGGGK